MSTVRRLHSLPSDELPGGIILSGADTVRSRLLGLMGLPDLPRHRALLLPGCRSVHTLGMRFALDLVWLDARGKVLRQDAGVGPGRVRGCRWARAVVETRAGEGERVAAALAAVSSDGDLLPGLSRRTGAARGLLDEAGAGVAERLSGVELAGRRLRCARLAGDQQQRDPFARLAASRFSQPVAGEGGGDLVALGAQQARHDQP